MLGASGAEGVLARGFLCSWHGEWSAGVLSCFISLVCLGGWCDFKKGERLELKNEQFLCRDRRVEKGSHRGEREGGRKRRREWREGGEGGRGRDEGC